MVRVRSGPMSFQTVFIEHEFFFRRGTKQGRRRSRCTILRTRDGGRRTKGKLFFLCGIYIADRFR